MENYVVQLRSLLDNAKDKQLAFMDIRLLCEMFFDKAEENYPPSECFSVEGGFDAYWQDIVLGTFRPQQVDDIFEGWLSCLRFRLQAVPSLRFLEATKENRELRNYWIQGESPDTALRLLIRKYLQ
jgi:hypothetical protein